MKKCESVGSHFEGIPSPILWDILARLPTKACLNCKLVCKDWYSIIINLEFAALRSSRSPYFTLLLFGKFYSKRSNFLLLDFDKSSIVDEMGNINVNSEAMIKFNFKFFSSHYKLSEVYECNGLICFKSRGQWTPLFICNLLTGEQVIINQVRKTCCSVEIYGFGCCLESFQFKVVRIISRLNGHKFEAQVCTVGTNEWRVVGNTTRYHFCQGTAFLHGSLHRVAYGDKLIWAFHFGNEKLFHIPMPDIIKRFSVGYVHVFESCLSLSRLSEDLSMCEIWVMKEYGVKGSWVKLFVLSRETYTRGDAVIPLFRMNDKEILIRHGCGSSLATSDTKSGIYKRAKVLGIKFFRVIAGNIKFLKL